MLINYECLLSKLASGGVDILCTDYKDLWKRRLLIWFHCFYLIYLMLWFYACFIFSFFEHVNSFLRLQFENPLFICLFLISAWSVISVACLRIFYFTLNVNPLCLLAAVSLFVMTSDVSVRSVAVLASSVPYRFMCTSVVAIWWS